MVVDVHILHLQEVLLVFFSSDALATVADLAEGVVEVTAVQANPIRVGFSFRAMGVLHDRNRNCEILFNSLYFNFIPKTEDQKTVSDEKNYWALRAVTVGLSIIGITILVPSLILR